jgi:hypothetical protein
VLLVSTDTYGQHNVCIHLTQSISAPAWVRVSIVSTIEDVGHLLSTDVYGQHDVESKRRAHTWLDRFVCPCGAHHPTSLSRPFPAISEELRSPPIHSALHHSVPSASPHSVRISATLLAFPGLRWITGLWTVVASTALLCVCTAVQRAGVQWIRLTFLCSVGFLVLLIMFTIYAAFALCI